MKGFKKLFYITILAVILSASLSGCGGKEKAVTVEEALTGTYYPLSDNLICAEKDGLWGYINKNGKVKIDFIYQNAYAFENGGAIVKSGEKWGMINPRGKTVVDFIYDGIYSSDGLLIAELDGKDFVINKNGKLVGEKFSYIRFFKGGYGLAYDFSDGVYTHYLINDKGQIKFTLPANTESVQLLNGYLVVVDGHGTYSLYSLKGKLLLDDNYVDLTPAGKYLIAAKEWGDEVKYGLINLNGKTKLDFTYDYLEYSVLYDIFYAEKDGKSGVLSSNGKTVIRCSFDGVVRLSDKNYAVATLEEDDSYKITLLDQRGKDLRVLENTFGGMAYYNGYIAVINDEGKYGLINQKGKIKLSYSYDYLGIYSDGLICFEKGQNFGCVNLKGKTVIPAEYEEELVFADGLAIAKKEGKLGVINKRNKTVVSFEYSKIRTAESTFSA